MHIYNFLKYFTIAGSAGFVAAIARP